MREKKRHVHQSRAPENHAAGRQIDPSCNGGSRSQHRHGPRPKGRLHQLAFFCVQACTLKDAQFCHPICARINQSTLVLDAHTQIPGAGLPLEATIPLLLRSVHCTCRAGGCTDPHDGPPNQGSSQSTWDQKPEGTGKRREENPCTLKERTGTTCTHLARGGVSMYATGPHPIRCYRHRDVNRPCRQNKKIWQACQMVVTVLVPAPG